jgi:hypothetical protein
VTTVEFMHHERCISPFKKFSAKYKEEDMNPNKHIMVVCVFLSSSPAWELSLVETILYPVQSRVVRCSAPRDTTQHFPTEHHTEESPRGGGGARHFYNTTSPACQEHVPAALTIAQRSNLRCVHTARTRA